MERRTRSELIDLLSLVFAIKVPVTTGFGSAEEIAGTTGISADRVRRMMDCGLIRPDPTAMGANFLPDDARVVAIANEILDLGADDGDISNYADFVLDRCNGCAGDPCPTRCDAVEGLRAMLARLERAATGPMRQRRLRQAIGSVDALGDLV